MSRASSPYRLWQQEGYTLVELLVGLMVMTLLAGVVYTIFLSTMRWVEPWRREMLLENESHLIVQRLVYDLRNAEQVFRNDVGDWVLTYPEEKVVTYRWVDSTLARNNQPMHHASLLIPHFQLVLSQNQLAYARRLYERSFDDERSVDRVTIHLAIASRERTVSFSTQASLRRHRPWFPLR